jgi:hypothetical protein
MRPRSSSPAVFVERKVCTANVFVGSSHLQLAMPYWSVLWSRLPASAPGNALRTSPLLTSVQGSSADAVVDMELPSGAASGAGFAGLKQAVRSEPLNSAANMAERSG